MAPHSGVVVVVVVVAAVVAAVVAVVFDVEDGARVVADELAVLPLDDELHHHEAGDDEAVDHGVD